MDGVTGRRPIPAGRRLLIDLEDLAELLECGFGEEGGRINLETGDVWRASTVDYFAEQEPEQAPDFEDPDLWLSVQPEGSHEGYRDMEDFIATLDDPGRADRLGIAMSGRGAFRRFRDTICRWPDEQERWHRFSDERIASAEAKTSSISWDLTRDRTTSSINRNLTTGSQTPVNWAGLMEEAGTR